MTDPKIQERLAKLRNKMAKTDLGGGTGFWSPPSGSSIIRILPELTVAEGGTMEEGIFYQQVGQHYIPGGNKKTAVYCPNWTTEGVHACPICDLVAELWKGDEEAKELARQLRHDRKFWMNVVVRDKEDKGGNTGSGPFIFTPGVTVFGGISALVNSPDLEYEITDIDYGLDIEIRKTGEKLNTEYNVFPRILRKNIPVHTDDVKFNQILNARRNLMWVMLTNDKEEDKDVTGNHAIALLPYDRMIAELGIGPGMDLDKLAAQPEQQNNARDAVHQRRGTQPAQEEETAFPVQEVRTDEVGSAIQAARQRMRGGR